ncbi:MAG TPA: cytochrome c [Caulobacteraceae bacterium]|nr:cytochrome c [Caulobacteraceae bacterium]
MRAAVALLGLLLTGCDEMIVQPRADAYEPSSLFPNGQVNQLPPDGTVAQEDAAWQSAGDTRPQMSAALLVRGQARYRIACVQCHGEAGDGDGVIVSRGFPRPPAFTDPKVAALTSAQVTGVIARGYGVMYPQADRVAPADRWAIAAYVQALQLSAAAPQRMLAPQDLKRLEAAHAP